MLVLLGRGSRAWRGDVALVEGVVRGQAPSIPTAGLKIPSWRNVLKKVAIASLCG